MIFVFNFRREIQMPYNLRYVAHGAVINFHETSVIRYTCLFHKILIGSEIVLRCARPLQQRIRNDLIFLWKSEILGERAPAAAARAATAAAAAADAYGVASDRTNLID